MEWRIISIGANTIYLPILLDRLGLLFRSVVLFISGNVFMFANLYIREELYNNRFLYLVLIFILSINFLIFIPHTIGLLLGWDGLGLVSFVLVIYYQNKKSLSGGMITALRNRVGDVFLLLRIGWILRQGHWKALFIWDTRFSRIIIIRIIIAAITKRAQIPFSSWLPAAIAAPTPVRALVHSSTLVTAGVFLLIRFYPFLSRSKEFNKIILVISCLTIFIAGASALVECDIKKIIALSTLRQLGVIMASIGLGFPILAFFHLITHALFKALLFICAGTLIHLHHHSQDLRVIGNLIGQLPITTTSINIANIALCGLPFMAGFYSKDLIIEIVIYRNYSVVIIFLFIGATIITAAYSIRLVFTGRSCINIGLRIQYIEDNRIDNTTPIILLGTGGITIGSLINWFFLKPSIEPILTFDIKLLAFLITILGGLFIYFNIHNKSVSCLKISQLHYINSYIWFLTPISTQIIISCPLTIAKYNLTIVDQGWGEVIGGQGVFNIFNNMFLKNQSLQRSIIIGHLSITIILIGVIILLCL